MYRPGCKNANADALSRSPLEGSSEEDPESQVAAVMADESLNFEAAADSALSAYQSEDPHYVALIDYLETGKLPSDPDLSRKILSEKDRFIVIERVLYYCDLSKDSRLRLCVPKSMRVALMTEAHAGRFAGHFSPRAVYSTLAKRYWWDGMYRDVHSHCHSCLICATYQGTGRRTKQPLMSIPVGGAFHRVGVDIMELPLTTNGNRYVITFIDYLTKWVESFASADQTSETIAKLLVDGVICRHGVPEYLVSDRGSNLLSSLMQEVYEATGIHKLSTTAYHPQTDGLVENFNRTLRAMVAKYAGSNWDEHLQYLLFAYRTKPHESTGESPFFLLYRRDARLPCESVLSTKRTHYQVDLDDYKSELVFGLADAWQAAGDSIQKAQRKQKRNYDRHSKTRAIRVAGHSKTRAIRVADRVMVLMPPEQTGKRRKLNRPYFGPYRVLEVHPNGVTVVPVDRPKDPSIRVNLDRVTLCYPELPDVSWTGGRSKHRKDSEKSQ